MHDSSARLVHGGHASTTCPSVVRAVARARIVFELDVWESHVAARRSWGRHTPWYDRRPVWCRSRGWLAAQLERSKYFYTVAATQRTRRTQRENTDVAFHVSGRVVRPISPAVPCALLTLDRSRQRYSLVVVVYAPTPGGEQRTLAIFLLFYRILFTCMYSGLGVTLCTAEACVCTSMCTMRQTELSAVRRQAR